MSLIAAYANDAVTITPKGTLAYDGRAADGTPVVTTGWVNDKAGYTWDKNGNEVRWTRVVYLDPSETVDVGDKITHNSVEHIVVMVKRNNDLANVSEHIKVMVK